jgi:hypothetical protein
MPKTYHREPCWQADETKEKRPKSRWADGVISDNKAIGARD